MSHQTEDIDLNTIAIGDIVTSRWSSNGALWRVTAVGDIDQPLGRSTKPRRHLALVGVKSGRIDSRRSTYDLVKVVTA